MRAGVFDSGIGGLSVVKSLLEHKLFEKIVYYGDTARVPYGSKDKNTIIRYAIEAVEFFKNFDLDIIIVACNSVSAYALEEMQEVSDIPVVGVVEAGVIATSNKVKRKTDEILIIGTKATIGSQAYEKGLSSLGFSSLTAKATPLFVPLVEEGIFSGEILDATLKHYFNSLSTPKAIILGCTHFPLISESIQSFFNNEPTMVHSGEAIVELLEKNFTFSHRFDSTDLRFFASDNFHFISYTVFF